ncbi:hypothetical protein GCM10027030_12090 [Luteococcus sediminum]
MNQPSQTFTLRVGGHDYVAECSGRLTTHVRLLRDGDEVLSGTEVDTTGTIRDDDVPESLWLRRTRTGRVRRVTLKGVGREVDMDPEPGSPAAVRLEKERQHPWRYAALDVLTAVVGVLVPLLGLGALLKWLIAPLLAWLLGLLPDISLPPIPWPDIDWPGIPWPDIDWPSIPWPHVDLSWIPDFTLPAWLVWILDHERQVKPVLFATVIAVAEVRRRRKQDREKARLADNERRELLTRLARAMQQVAETGPRSVSGRQPHLETRPAPLRVGDPDAPAVGGDQLVHDRQPQA